MKASQGNIIYTIGHSNHPIDIFIKLLDLYKIKLLADIRSFPGSKYCPQFNKEELRATLLNAGIKYIHLPDLGGRRKVKKDSLNTGWKNSSFRGYADYMETELFRNAIQDLEDRARKEAVAYMCSEALWWSCHRSMVSDFLKWKDWKVFHILSNGKLEEHPYTSPARIIDHKLSYTSDPSTDLFSGM